MKLSAGTLAYALAISLIIGMITASVLLNEHFNRLLIHRDAVREEVVRNANSGIVYLCAQNNPESFFSDDIDLFGREKDSVEIASRPWGIYDILTTRAHTGDAVCLRMAIAGSVTEAEDRYALWLGDMDRPLKVCGKTELKGKCYLPKAGIERTYIEGRSFSGRDLVQGAIASSSRFIPEFNKVRFAEMEKLLSGNLSPEDSLVSWEEISAMDSVFTSFGGSVCAVSEKSPIQIADIFMEGQIRIYSAVSITVHSSAALFNVLLVAPEIMVENHTTGIFQVIARDSIVLGEDVTLNFPSSLSLCSNEHSPLQTGIVLKKGCTVNGDVFAVSSQNELNRQLLVNIPAESEILGNVYCNSRLELEGRVRGSVTCQKFSLTTNSAVYENTLLDAIIENDALSLLNPGGNMMGNATRKEVIAWVF